MSTFHPDTHLDLIDFHVLPPVLPRHSSISETHFEQESENLIDTELPIFEQKLQTASSTIGCHSRRTSIDVEDILINIDSDEFETDSLDGEPVETGEFLDVCDGVTVDNGNNEAGVLPVDNFEALLVLKNLDDLLNATLEESNDILNKNSNNYQQEAQESIETDENTQQIIEECLEDLDNYLKAIDDDDSTSHTLNKSFSSDEQSTSRDSLSISDCAGNSIFEEDKDSRFKFDEELARNKLRKIEQNYNKFVSSGIVNRGYVDTENNTNFMHDGQLRRPSSACAVTSQALSRKHPHRSATLAAVRKERPRLVARRKSLNENNTAQHCTLSRTSAADANSNTPENWLTSSDVTRERHAHASGDCCTGTVIVEPLHKQSKANSSSASVVNEDPHAALPKEQIRRTLRGTWLRSSMRRLQHLNLPSAESAENENSAGIEEVDANRLEVPPTNVRPVSAPSRLPPIRTSTGRSSRSRSRDSVSHEPNGRARSSSASSHSRRRRSLSSSVTSLASSAESTLSRMPPSDVTNGTNGHVPTTNEENRTYSFLSTGIMYGFLKHQALTSLEAGRADEKVRKRAERDARLIEEKRLAAVRDFNQIVEIFSPPPKVKTAYEIELTEQEYKQSVQGVSNQICDSNYGTIYDSDYQSKDPEARASDLKTDDSLQPEFFVPCSEIEADSPKSDDYIKPDYSSVFKPGTQKADDSPKLDGSHNTSVLVEADIPKTDDSSTNKFYDQPIDMSIDDFTKGLGDKGDGSEDKERCDVELPDSGYIIKDFDDIPVMPSSNEEGRFPPEN